MTPGEKTLGLKAVVLASFPGVSGQARSSLLERQSARGTVSGVR